MTELLFNNLRPTQTKPF